MVNWVRASAIAISLVAATFSMEASIACRSDAWTGGVEAHPLRVCLESIKLQGDARASTLTGAALDVAPAEPNQSGAAKLSTAVFVVPYGRQPVSSSPSAVLALLTGICGLALVGRGKHRS